MSAPARRPSLQRPSRRRPAQVRHVILPGQEVARTTARRRETIARLLERTGWQFRLPTIVEIDGVPVLRRDRGWKRRRIHAGEAVTFLSRPQGGGSNSGKSVIGLVAMVALSALVPGIGAALTPILGGVGSALATGAIVAGAGFAINTLLAPKVSNKSQDTTKTLYSFGPQTNSARLREALPVQYGRIKKTPDFAQLPWTQYVGDDAYIHVLLVDGEGRYQREQIDVGSATLWTAADGLSADFKDVEIAFYDPGEPITLFPTNIAASAEVTGQQLDDETQWSAPVSTNAAGTKCYRLAFDFAYLGGLYGQDGKGNLIPYMSRIQIQIRPINDVGAPTGDWAELVQHDRWGASKDPMRFSLEQDVPAGATRFQVRVKRGVPKDVPGTHVDTVIWAGLRAYLVDAPPSYPVSTTAIRMKASGQLSSTTATQFRTITTRILRVFTGTAWEEQPTRLCAWAGLDLATNDTYACGLSLADVDVQAFVDLAAGNAARGEYFDYEFRSVVQATEALDMPLRVCRARHRWLGSTLSLVRESWRAVPEQLLTDNQIVRDSLSIRYDLQTDDACDAIIAEYLDETTWQSAEVQVPADVVPLRPRYVEWPGAVQRSQVWSLTSFLWRQNAYRRVKPTLTTERDGRMLAYGDVIALQSDLPMRWGEATCIKGRSGLNLRCDTRLTWGEGQHYINVRTATGKAFGPVKVSRGATDRDVVLDAADLALVEAQQGRTLDQALARRDTSEPASAVLGLESRREVRALVLRGQPSGNRVKLELVVDHEEVHQDDLDPGDVPAAPTLRDPDIPQVYGLYASLEQNITEPMLSATWLPAAGAYYYLAWLSYDGGDTWRPLGEFRTNSLYVVAQPAALTLAVQAVGKEAGAWATYAVPAPLITADRLTIKTSNLEAGLRDLVTTQAAAVSEAVNQSVASAHEAAATALAQLTLLRQEIAPLLAAMPRNVRAVTHKLRAEVVEQIETATGPDSALAHQIETVVAETENLVSVVEDNRLAQVAGDTALAADIETVSTANANNAAAIVDEQAARVDADSALAGRVETVEAEVIGPTSTLATYGSQISTLAGQQGATTTWLTELNAAYTTTTDYISAHLTMTWTVSASEGGAVSTWSLQTIAGAHQAGMHVVAGPTGSFLVLEAEKMLLRGPLGDIGIFDTVEGRIYFKADMYLDGSFTTAKFAAGSVTTDILSVGGVTTDRVALAAINNIISQRRTTTASTGDELNLLRVDRTAETNIRIQATVYAGYVWGAHSDAFGFPDVYRRAIIRRYNADFSAYVDVEDVEVHFDTHYAYSKDGLTYWAYGAEQLTIDVLDEADIAGDHYYQFMLLSRTYESIGWGGGYGVRTLILHEIKR